MPIELTDEHCRARILEIADEIPWSVAGNPQQSIMAVYRVAYADGIAAGIERAAKVCEDDIGISAAAIRGLLK